MIHIENNIILLGTSHVSKKSVDEIRQVIEKYEPNAVGIELDLGRLKTILSEDKSKSSKSYKVIKEIGLSGYIFATVASFIQQKIGKSLGINPGLDMKAGYEIAREKEIPVALIDIEIKKTLKKISKLKFTKKLGLFFNLFFKSFKKEYRQKLNKEFETGDVPDDEIIDLALEIFEKEAKPLYDILIEDRNKYMVERLLKIKEDYNQGYILAVVGAGHLKGMIDLLKQEPPKQDSNSFSYIVDL